jgi:hypothetical protein
MSILIKYASLAGQVDICVSLLIPLHSTSANLSRSKDVTYLKVNILGGVRQPYNPIAY